MRPIGVLGAGSFGTAMAIHLARAGHATRLWARRVEAAEQLARDRSNETYLGGSRFPDRLEIHHDLVALAEVEPLVVAVPSHGFRLLLADWLARRSPARTATIVSTTKGIEPGTLARMSVVTAEEAARAGVGCRFAVLSGPTFAEELAKGMPSAAVIASQDPALAASLREALSSPTLRLYSSSDVLGVELAGTAKNVIAIGAGILSGLGLGHNTLAALITRGLHEITRLVLACGGDAETLRGLAGLGDLVLTCTGGLSRNRRTGIELARGRTLAEITGGTTQIAEGVKNSLAIAALARAHGVEMPITEQMVGVLYEGKPARAAIHELMTRDLKHETEI